MGKVFCGQCGFENNTSNKFCNNCGASLFKSDDVITKQSKPNGRVAKKTLESEANNKSSNGKAIFIILIICLAMLGYCTKSNHNSDSTNDENVATKEVVSNSAWDGSVFQVEEFLKNQYLKDLDSYKGIDWSKVQVFPDNPKYKYMVRHKFRAKNGFGGYNVENKVFYLDDQGVVVDYKDFE